MAANNRSGWIGRRWQKPGASFSIRSYVRVLGCRDRMKPPPFEYRVAESVEAAVAALAEAGGEAKVLAGGQSLVPMLNFRLLRPSILVDINRIPGLAYIEEKRDSIRVGALTRHHQLETSPVVTEH